LPRAGTWEIVGHHDCPGNGLDDPAGLDVEAVRPIRDDIGRRVKDLLDGLTTRQGRRPTSR
jgi:hypothetical protein